MEKGLDSDFVNGMAAITGDSLANWPSASLLALRPVFSLSNNLGSDEKVHLGKQNPRECKLNIREIIESSCGSLTGMSDG